MVNPPFILSRFCVRPPPPKSHWSSGETSTRTTHHKIRQLVLTKNEVQDVSVGVVREGFTEETALSGHLSRNQRSWAWGPGLKTLSGGTCPSPDLERSPSKARSLPSASTHSWLPAPSASSAFSQLTGEFPYPQACVCYQLGGKLITRDYGHTLPLLNELRGLKQKGLCCLKLRDHAKLQGLCASPEEWFSNCFQPPWNRWKPSYLGWGGSVEGALGEGSRGPLAL